MSEKKLMSKCDDLISDLEFNRGFIDLNKMIITDLMQMKEPQNVQSINSITHQISKLKERESELLNLRLDAEISNDLYKEKKNDLVKQVKRLENEKNLLQNDKVDEKLKTMFELAESPYQRYKSKNAEQKSAFLKSYMFELSVNNKKELAYADNSMYSCLKLVQKYDFSSLEVPSGFEPL